MRSSADESARGGRKVYEVLDAGREELRRWVAEPADPRPLREELMVRLRADAAVGPCGLEPEIARRLALHQAQLAVYQAIEQRDFPAGGDQRAQRLQHLVLQAGIMVEAMWCEFSERALAILNEPEPEAGAGFPAADQAAGPPSP